MYPTHKHLKTSCRNLGNHKDQIYIQRRPFSLHIPHSGHFTLVLLRRAGMNDCVGETWLQIEKGQTPAGKIPGPGQAGVKLLLSTHKGTKCPEVRVGVGIGPETPSPDLLPLPLLPLDLATQMGCDEGRKRRAGLRCLWSKWYKERLVMPVGQGTCSLIQQRTCICKWHTCWKSSFCYRKQGGPGQALCTGQLPKAMNLGVRTRKHLRITIILSEVITLFHQMSSTSLCHTQHSQAISKTHYCIPICQMRFCILSKTDYLFLFTQLQCERRGNHTQ